MSYPVLDTSHVSEGLALLTDHYRNKTVIPGLLKCYLNRIQDAENMLWGVINAGLLVQPNGVKASGDALTRLAGLVGLERNTANDSELFSEVILKIRTNRSQGSPEDIIDVATLAAQGTGTPVYTETPIASFAVQVSDILSALVSSPITFANYLNQAKSVGVRGVLIYTTWPDIGGPTGDLEWGSAAAPNDVHTGRGTWGSVYTNTVGGVLSACAEVM